MSDFLTKNKCDRCDRELKDGRIMSMFNEDCICMECKRKERQNKDYKRAQEKEIEEVRKGNFNYQGIRDKV